MEIVKAYKCDFCERIYENQSSCRSHESRCYYNAKTKSCATCALLVIEQKEYKPNHYVQFNGCMANIAIASEGLKTHCQKYLNQKYMEDKEMMAAVKLHYDFKTPFKVAISKVSAAKIS